MKDIKKLVLESLLAGLKEEGDEGEIETKDMGEPVGEEKESAFKSLSDKLLNKDDSEEEVKMPKKDFEAEHTALISKLMEKDPEKLDKEASAQAGELKDVEEKDSEDPKDSKGVLKLALLLMKNKKKG